MILHGYWRSGTSYRTRIALNLKGVEYRQAALDLRTGAQKSDAYLRLNPQGLVPALETGDAGRTDVEAHPVEDGVDRLGHRRLHVAGVAAVALGVVDLDPDELLR